MLISSHTVPVPIAKVNIDGVRRVPDHLDARLKAIRRKYRQWPCPLDISLLILNLTVTYRERWRGWPCETAATGWFVSLRKSAIVQVPNPARCGPHNAGSSGEDKERVPTRIRALVFLYLKRGEVDPR